MEDATITQEAPQELYAQGKYPTIIDTDDLVFELGKQLIGNLNKEKLLDNLLQKSKLLEQLAIEAKKDFLAANERTLALEESNASYLQNNTKLDSELSALTKLRLETKEASLASSKRNLALEESNARYLQNNKKLDSELVKLRSETSTARKEYTTQINALTKQVGVLKKKSTELVVHIADLSKKLELAVIENEKLRKPAPKPRTRRKTAVKKLVDKE